MATIDGLYALVAAIGGDAISGIIRHVSGPLRVISAIVLMYMAVRVAWEAVRRDQANGPSAKGPEADLVQATPVRAFADLAVVTAVNPATFAYFAALVAGSSGHELTSATVLPLFAIAAWAASASWQLALTCGGVMIGRVLTGARGQLITAFASSLLISALAIRMLMSI